MFLTIGLNDNLCAQEIRNLVIEGASIRGVAFVGALNSFATAVLLLSSSSEAIKLMGIKILPI